VNEEARLRAVRATVALLVILGVSAAVGRTIFPDDLITRFEPVRQWLFDAFGRDDPRADTRAAALAVADGRFAAHPLLTRIHVVFGGLFVMFAPLQFSSAMRARNIRLHRWSGRILLPLAVISVITSLYFGILIPFGGLGEAIAIALFGGIFIASASRAYLAIRRKEVERHREWMIRTFAIALSISTVRLVDAPVDLILTPAGVRPPGVLVVAMWTGWVITVALAELWIRHTRANLHLRGNLQDQTPVTDTDFQT